MKRTKKHRSVSRSETAPLKCTVRACIIGTASTFGISLAAIAAMALLLLNFDYPHAYILPLGLFCIYFSAFVGGFIGACCDRAHTLFCGGAVGAAVFLLLWAIFSLLDPLLGVEGAGLISLPLKAAVIPSSVLGSLFGKGRSSQRRKRPKNF